MARAASQDPLEKFRFKIDIVFGTITATGAAPKEIVMRAGFHDAQMPKRATNKISYREGNNPELSSLSPGLSSTEDIVLSRGLVAQNATGFYKWASQSHEGMATDAVFDFTVEHTATSTPEAEDLRKDLTITMFDRTGAPARKWFVSNAFVVNFAPGSDLNASEDGEKSLESITLAYEDFYEISPDATGSITEIKNSTGDVTSSTETI